MYVCENQAAYQMVDCKEEFRILDDALKQVGSKGEVKISEWVRGSKVSWTNEFDKSALSYGNHRGRDIGFWRKFLKQCHVLSLVQMKLKSLIKSSGYYAVQAVYSPSPNSGQVLNNDDSLMLPIQSSRTHDNSKSIAGVSDAVNTECTVTNWNGILAVLLRTIFHFQTWSRARIKYIFIFSTYFHSN